jgi:hypothetical protein
MDTRLQSATKGLGMSAILSKRGLMYLSKQIQGELDVLPELLCRRKAV